MVESTQLGAKGVSPYTTMAPRLTDAIIIIYSVREYCKNTTQW